MPIVLAVRCLYIWRKTKGMPHLLDNPRSVDVELVGGPEDGHKTIILLKEAGAVPDEYLDNYNRDNRTIYRYKRTKRRTKEGFLVYEYAGRKRQTCRGR
jgi:hypothetical protein